MTEEELPDVEAHLAEATGMPLTPTSATGTPSQARLPYSEKPSLFIRLDVSY